MDISVITQFYMPIVIVACLCIGYVIKHSLDFIPNKYIPAIMFILGCVFGCIVNQKVDFVTLVSGAVSGLASTGFYEMFRNIIEKGEQ